MPAPETAHPILLFDGICNYCNRSVNFVIRHDPEKKFRFAALQSETGKQLLRKFHLPEEYSESFVLIENGKMYLRSGAALRVLIRLGGIYSLARILLLAPSFIRDAGYTLISKNRYRWWGKREACMIPSPDVRDRFL